MLSRGRRQLAAKGTFHTKCTNARVSQLIITVRTAVLDRPEEAREMPVIGFDHVQLAIPEGAEATARWFYGAVLGLPEIPKPANLASRGGVWFQCGPLQLHLGVEADFHPARKAHPGLLVRDLAAIVRQGEAAGFATKADEPLKGFVRVHLSDPFGNRLELLEPTCELPEQPGR
jgi:catechol 2,3-dioxygenase-like lactoylglutathione lyase family enzyme